MHVNDPEIEDLLFVVDCSKSEIITQSIACVASVSNRVIARKLEREQKKGGSLSFLDEPREEKLATQATQSKTITT